MDCNTNIHTKLGHKGFRGARTGALDEELDSSIAMCDQRLDVLTEGGRVEFVIAEAPPHEESA